MMSLNNPDDVCLAGLRVIDLTRLFPGGLCTLALADLGAEVIKIEAVRAGDYARARGPHRPSKDESVSSLSFTALNRGKRSLALDLKTGSGRNQLLELVREADVVVESFRPGVMDRLELSHDDLLSVNPAVVLCSISGWGQTGSRVSRAGHDINYLAETGMLSATGSVDEHPVVPLMQVADATGGLVAAIAILAATLRSKRTGRGEHVDVSLAHAAMTTAAMTVGMALGGVDVPRREDGLWSGGVVCYQTYKCSDGWVALGALEEKFWRAWCSGVDRPDLVPHRYDPSGSWAHDEVRSIFMRGSRAQWAAFAESNDCCLSVVRGLQEALDSELVRGRGTVVRSPHCTGQETITVESLAFPVLVGDSRHQHRAAAPVLDEYRDSLHQKGKNGDA